MTNLNVMSHLDRHAVQTLSRPMCSPTNTDPYEKINEHDQFSCRSVGPLLVNLWPIAIQHRATAHCDSMLNNLSKPETSQHGKVITRESQENWKVSGIILVAPGWMDISKANSCRGAQLRYPNALKY